MSSSVAAQVSDKMDPGQLVSLIAALNPENTPGRLTVIIRMGAVKVRNLCWEQHVPGTSELVPIRCLGNTLHRNVSSERQKMKHGLPCRVYAYATCKTSLAQEYGWQHCILHTRSCKFHPQSRASCSH